MWKIIPYNQIQQTENSHKLTENKLVYNEKHN